jgi:hypothetical protein
MLFFLISGLTVPTDASGRDCHMQLNLRSSRKSSYTLFFIISGVGLSPLGTAATSGLLYKTLMIDEGDCGAIGGMRIGRGNRSTRRKPAPVPFCPPQNPTWPDPGSNPGRRGGKPATSRLSYGAAIIYTWWIFNWSNPSSRTMALGSIQPLTEVSTRNLPGG